MRPRPRRPFRVDVIIDAAPIPIRQLILPIASVTSSSHPVVDGYIYLVRQYFSVIRLAPANRRNRPKV